MKHANAHRRVPIGPVAALLFISASAGAYTGQNCSAPGVCWEPKPGFSAQIAGSKYDPKHDPKEIAKQSNSIVQMEARNKLRVDYFKKSGKFIYDVDKIPKQ
jgi:methanol dehydrogenase (cytochrome c) subunit 2